MSVEIFAEVLRSNELDFKDFAQLSSSLVYEGIVKAWHLHNIQTEMMTNLSGVVKFAFYDSRKNSPSHGLILDFLVDASVNPLAFVVPPGVAHGYRIVRGPAVLCYLTDRIYDPNDQLKIAYDDKSIGYHWGPPKIQ
ncbi:MAG: dTDP-4-dehydrorhamnose 3,5-epimerase family protein [Bdellovibrionales bacterium]|nr:dTDP-4-dehydrorhamnose 3,5-epimerase family protein [Bdellovibrionales bacterium]